MKVFEKSALAKSIKAFFEQISMEKNPRLKVSELSAISRSEVLSHIDWELNRLDEAEKVFGVNAWSLLVGVGVLLWAFASLPAFEKLNFELVIWGFILLETGLLFLEGLWALATYHGSDHAMDRAIRISIFAGVSSLPQLAVGCMRFFVLLVVSLACAQIIPVEIRLFTSLIVSLGLVALVGLLVLARSDLTVHLLAGEKAQDRRIQAISGLNKFILFIGPLLVLPILTWSWAIAEEALPNAEIFRAAGLLVAIGYLLRMFLVSTAKLKPRTELERLRRDLALNYVDTEDAALELSWRLSGLPTSVYVNARLAVLIDELGGIIENLKRGSGNVSEALQKLGSASQQEQLEMLPTMKGWLGELIRPDLALKAQKVAEHRSEAFLIFFGARAKTCPAYRVWEKTCKDVQSAGGDYAEARRRIDSLIEEIRNRQASTGG